MKKHYAIIGLGRFGFNMAKTLAENKCEVIAIDKDEERVRKASEYVTLAVQLEAMDEKALRSIGVQNVDVAIVSIGENIEASILVVMILKQMGVRYIVAKAVKSLHGTVLRNLNVDRIVYPERDMAIRVAHSLIKPTILEQLELSDEYSIIEIPSPKVFVGKMLKETRLRSDLWRKPDRDQGYRQGRQREMECQSPADRRYPRGRPARDHRSEYGS